MIAVTISFPAYDETIPMLDLWANHSYYVRTEEISELRDICTARAWILDLQAIGATSAKGVEMAISEREVKKL